MSFAPDDLGEEGKGDRGGGEGERGGDGGEASVPPPLLLKCYRLVLHHSSFPPPPSFAPLLIRPAGSLRGTDRELNTAGPCAHAHKHNTTQHNTTQHTGCASRGSHLSSSLTLLLPLLPPAVCPVFTFMTTCKISL